MMKSEAAISNALLALDHQLMQCATQGPPRKLGRIDHEDLRPGETSQSVVLHDWRECLVVQARLSQSVDHWLWLQVDYKVCSPLNVEFMLVQVPPRAYVCVNRWRPSGYPGDIGPGSVELYGWELSCEG